jgi:hypothetical protein
VAVQRFIDRNDNLKVTDDPFVADVVNVIDRGNSGQFKDKPWNAVDQPGRSWNSGKTCMLPGRTQAVPAFSVYVAYANFTGSSADNPHPQIYVARSHDCGATFEKEIKISASIATNQGATVSVDPVSGAVYVAWRQFNNDANQSLSGVYFARSRDGGKQWDSPVRIADIAAFDQGPSSSTRFRSNALPTMAVSVDAAGVSRVHVAWAERGKGPAGPAGTVRGARIMMATSRDGGATWPSIAPVDYAGLSPSNTFNTGGLGHQLQPSLAFAGGKLTAVWIDQRNDHTVAISTCSRVGGCASIAEYEEKLLPMTINGELADSLAQVFSDWVTDTGLRRRHTLDIYGAQATRRTLRISRLSASRPTPRARCRTRPEPVARTSGARAE